MAVAFDTLRLARKLEAAGFGQKQAADIAEALAEAMVSAELVTKEHLDFRLRESEHRLESRIDRLEAKVDAEFASVCADIKTMELRMTIKLGGLIAAGVAVLAAMKFFGH